MKRESIIHRTKCTALIDAVIGPAVHEEINDIGNESYSLIIVESTDVTTKKQLCVGEEETLKSHKHKKKAGWVTRS